MNEFYKKISKIKYGLESQYGNFDLFCIVELEDFKGQWDIVVSATWLPPSEAQALSLLIDHIHDGLSEEELLQVLGVIVLSIDEPFVKDILALSRSSMNDVVISGLSINTIHVLSKQQSISKSLEEKLAAIGLTEEDIYNLIKNYNEKSSFSEKLHSNQLGEDNFKNAPDNIIHFPSQSSPTKLEKQSGRIRQG
jgi:hypothetical protein